MKKTITIIGLLAISWTATAAETTYIHETLNGALVEKYSGTDAYTLKVNVGGKAEERFVQFCAELDEGDKAINRDTLKLAQSTNQKVIAQIRTNFDTKDTHGGFSGCLKDSSIMLGR